MSGIGVKDSVHYYHCWYGLTLMIIGCLMGTAFASDCIPPNIS